jgi:hypothetical protein
VVTKKTVFATHIRFLKVSGLLVVAIALGCADQSSDQVQKSAGSSGAGVKAAELTDNLIQITNRNSSPEKTTPLFTTLDQSIHKLAIENRGAYEGTIKKGSVPLVIHIDIPKIRDIARTGGILEVLLPNKKPLFFKISAQQKETDTLSIYSENRHDGGFY